MTLAVPPAAITLQDRRKASAVDKQQYLIPLLQVRSELQSSCFKLRNVPIQTLGTLKFEVLDKFGLEKDDLPQIRQMHFENKTLKENKEFNSALYD